MWKLPIISALAAAVVVGATSSAAARMVQTEDGHWVKMCSNVVTLCDQWAPVSYPRFDLADSVAFDLTGGSDRRRWQYRYGIDTPFGFLGQQSEVQTGSLLIDLGPCFGCELSARKRDAGECFAVCFQERAAHE